MESKEIKTGHNYLMQLVGKWEGIKKIYPYPEELMNTDTTQAEIKPKMGATFIEIRYSHKLKETSYDGCILLGYSERKNQYQASWIDQYHMGQEIMYLTGILNNDMLELQGSYEADDQTWGWIIEFKYTENKLAIQHFNVPPEGKKFLGVDIQYNKILN